MRSIAARPQRQYHHIQQVIAWSRLEECCTYHPGETKARKILDGSVAGCMKQTIQGEPFRVGLEDLKERGRGARWRGGRRNRGRRLPPERKPSEVADKAKGMIR